MKTKSLTEVKNELIQKQSVLVDIREPKEFKDYNIEGSINIPASNYDFEAFENINEANIVLVCQTGRRAKILMKVLEEKGIKNVYILDEHIEKINDRAQNINTSGWTIDRQFRLTLGVLLALFLTGNHYVSPYFIIIPIVLAAGLIITAIIDRCYMRMAIAYLPWNRKKKE